jgi:hypothetical protein
MGKDEVEVLTGAERVREQAKWSCNGTFCHEPPGAELQSTELIREEHRRHPLELTKLLCYKKWSDRIVPNRHGGNCKLAIILTSSAVGTWKLLRVQV